MRDYKFKNYKVKMRVEIIFDSDNYIYATDEMDAQAKAELLVKASIGYAFGKDINLKPLLRKDSNIHLKYSSINIKEMI